MVGAEQQQIFFDGLTPRWHAHDAALTQTPGCLQIGGEMSAITTDFTRRISESPCGHVKSGVGLEICKEKETRPQIIMGTRESGCDAGTTRHFPLRPSS
jgi:hypothetical protein